MNCVPFYVPSYYGLAFALMPDNLLALAARGIRPCPFRFELEFREVIWIYERIDTFLARHVYRIWVYSRLTPRQEVSALPEDDRTLIERMKDGDRGAKDAFFSKYIPVIYRTLYHTVEDAQEQDVNDLTELVCHTILEELDKYNPEFAVSTWVNNLVYRHSTGFRREREKFQDTHLSLSEAKDPRAPDERPLGDTLAWHGPDALLVLEGKERVAQAKLLIRKFLATLVIEKDREVFIDRQLFGLSYAEITEKHNLTLNAVKARLWRTRQKWAAFLKEHQNIE